MCYGYVDGIMIDAREYKTKEKLEEAMEFEKNCCELHLINELIFKLEYCIKGLKTKLDLYKKKKVYLEKDIANFYNTNPDKTIIKERGYLCQEVENESEHQT